MNIKGFLFAVILLLIMGDFALADRQLNKAEILQIFQTLTAQPRRTWIPAGIIKAKHLEYRASEGHIIESTVIVRYDEGSPQGTSPDRFYWEINIESYTGQGLGQNQPKVRPSAKPSPYGLDLNWNKKRVFVWDGKRYIRYFRGTPQGGNPAGNHAIVNESPSDIPIKVNGPLTAGIVPWGYGLYTLENLSALATSAQINDQGQIYLTLNMKDMQVDPTGGEPPEMVFVLDPAKDYAVLSYLISYAEKSIIKTCEDYKLVSGKWIPTTIIIERYDHSKQPPELLSYDEWNITSVSVSIPPAASFSVIYETDALVEYYLPVVDREVPQTQKRAFGGPRPLVYRYCDRVDTDALLQNRRAIVLADNTQTQNCAMIAMKYVAGQLGRNATDQELISSGHESLDTGPEGISLYQLQQMAYRLGFHYKAVKTDVGTLKNLKNCQAILHLPVAQHYVVLEHIDDEYVWLIDLSSNKFYYRIKLEQFGLEWSDGTALLVSNVPIYLQGAFTEISQEQLHKIIGLDRSQFGYYSCTELIQEYDEVFCPEPKGGLCGGLYRWFYNRWACEPTEAEGYCAGTDMIGNESSPCINDSQYPWECTITGERFSQHIRACQ